jgi:RNA polymerase sigma-70 factor, ECF subfamily
MIPNSWRDDAALLKKAVGGDRDAAATLVRRLMPAAHALAWRMTGVTALAEDIVQEAFIRLWKSAPRWEPRASVRTFFTRIVINLCYDHHRANFPDQPVDDSAAAETVDESPDVLEQMAAKESRSEVRAALYRLSPRYRAVLVMWAYSEMTVREIAAAMDLNQNAVHQLLYRARAGLRAQLGNGTHAKGRSHVA